jgi:hypothetical protein
MAVVWGLGAVSGADPTRVWAAAAAWGAAAGRAAVEEWMAAVEEAAVAAWAVVVD